MGHTMIIRSVLVTGLCLVAFVGNSSATVSTFLGTGEQKGSSNPDAELAFLESLAGVPDDLSFLGKVENGKSVDGDFDGTGINWGTDKSGKVQYNGTRDEVYMVLKYSKTWDAYHVTDIQSMNGMIPWPKDGSIDKGISHISFFGGTVATPEPAALAIWGTMGLAGFGFVWRKKKRSRG